MRNSIALNKKRKLYTVRYYKTLQVTRGIKILFNNQLIDTVEIAPTWCLQTQYWIRMLSRNKILDRCFLTGNANSRTKVTGLVRHMTRVYIKSKFLFNLVTASW